MLSPEQILKQYWGYDSFRHPQKEIINEVLQKHDVVGILPTGSGKSVIYQVAGMMMSGITLVISPLIALIEDQVTGLNQRGIKAIALTGSLSFTELERLLDNAEFGSTQFLFLSPERLQNEYVKKRLAQMNVNLITVDEAHCISEWGHDFRPSYTKIHKLREILTDVPVLALTATAKQNVVDDIITYLELNKPKIFRLSIVRKNIAYKVVFSDNKLHTLIQYLDKNKTAVVYVKTRKQTYLNAQYVAQQGFKTAFFHGGMSYEEKQQTLVDWLQNKTRIIFATTAFGMGIDKPDVRQVFHLDIPESLENYVQESGRAGRDGKKSEAIIFVEPNELSYLEKNHSKRLPDIDFIYKVYKSLFNHFYIAEFEGEALEVNLNFIEFCKRFNLEPAKTLQAMQILESEEIIKIFKTRKAFHTVKILLSPPEIRLYIEQKRYAYQIIDLFIRNYADIFYLNTKINIKKTAVKLEMSETEIIKTLKELDKRQIIDYQPAGDVFILHFLERRDDKLFQFHRNKIQKRLDLKNKQFKQVLDYVKNKTTCRSVFLANYFDENQIDDCQICDICLIRQNTMSDSEIMIKITALVQNNCLTKAQLQQELGTEIDIYLDKLIENNILFLSTGLKYCLNKNNNDNKQA